MTTIAELVQVGQALFAQRQMEHEQQVAQEAADKDARLQIKLAELREALQADDALWSSLQPRVTHDDGGYWYEITLFGRVVSPYSDLRGWRHDPQLRPVNAQTLSIVAYQAQLSRVQDTESVLHILTAGGGYHDWRDYGQAWEIARYYAGLWDEPAVQAARRAFLEKYRPQTLNDLPADSRWFETWITDGETLGLDAAPVVTLRNQVCLYEQMLANIVERMQGDGGSVAEAQTFYAWVAGLPDELGLPAAAIGVQYQTRLSEACARLASRVRGEHYRQRVAELEAAAFYPFRYFRVYYGILAERYAEDEDETLIEEQSEEALTYPAPGGEYINAHGKRIRALHISRIETVNVWTLAELPWFAPRVKTEDGIVYRVPPEQCVRLNTGVEESDVPDASDVQYHCEQCQKDFTLPAGMEFETCPLCGSRDWQLPF